MTAEQTSYYANVGAFALIVLLWLAFAATFMFKRKPASAPDRVGVPTSFWGLALQGVSFGIIWALRRTPMFSPFVDDQFVLNIVLQVVAVCIAAASVWLAMSAIRELGKQWSLQARLIEGHKLVMSGVYNTVRHPIYTAMLGMLVATGLVYTHWVVLIIAVAVFITGTRIRTNIEERLLRDAFGEEFENWRARVPGLVPYLF